MVKIYTQSTRWTALSSLPMDEVGMAHRSHTKKIMEIKIYPLIIVIRFYVLYFVYDELKSQIIIKTPFLV